MAAGGVTVGPLADKDKRAAVHRACALHYRGLSTKALSVTGEGGAVETLISITWAPKKGHKRKRGEAGSQGEHGVGRYLVERSSTNVAALCEPGRW